MITTCHWEITNRCNLSCIHCIAANGGTRELDTEAALKVISVLRKMDCKGLAITGGEPLVRKDIWQILKRAKEKKFKISLITNGTLINKTNINKAKSYIDELGISLDGSSPKINDKIRGHLSFEKAFRAILITLNNNIPLNIYITVNKINYYDFEEVLKLLVKIGVKNIRVNEISLRGRAIKNISRLKLEKNPKNELSNYLVNSIVVTFCPGPTQIVKSHDCEIDPKIIYLSSSGNIYPCVEVRQVKPGKNFGNILNLQPKTIDTYQKFVKSHKNSSCPYSFVAGPNYSICLNNESISCPLLK